MFDSLCGFGHRSEERFSEEEENFKEIVKQKYGFTVRHTFCEIGAGKQLHIYIWADFDTKDPAQKELHAYAARSTLSGSPSSPRCPEKFRQLGQSLADDYTHCFRIDSERISEGFVNLQDYHYSLRAWIYGHAIAPIRQRLFQECRIPPYRVLVYNEPAVTIMVENLLTGHRVSVHEQKIREICFRELRQFDEYEVITEEVLDIRIIRKRDVSPETWNDMARG